MPEVKAAGEIIGMYIISFLVVFLVRLDLFSDEDFPEKREKTKLNREVLKVILLELSGEVKTMVFGLIIGFILFPVFCWCYVLTYATVYSQPSPDGLESAIHLQTVAITLWGLFLSWLELSLASELTVTVPKIIYKFRVLGPRRFFDRLRGIDEAQEA